MSQNGQDNKCQCSSQSKKIIHFGVVAHEYTDVMGERVSADNSKNNVHKKKELGDI